MNWKGPASQNSAVKSLYGAFERGTFPQSVLITGVAGSGKRALVLHLAALLSCTGDALERPCGKCFSCKSLRDPEGGGHWLMALDLTAEEFKKEGARQQRTREIVEAILANPYGLDVWSSKGVITVAQIRLLREALSYRADEVRVFLVPEADRMNDSAANAFLKTLEEVPPRTYFLLTTSRPASLLATIRSRCLTVALPPLHSEEIKEILLQGGQDAAAVDAVLPFALGSAGQAQNHLAKDFSHLVNLALRFLEDSLQGRQADLFDLLQTEKQVSDPSTATLLLEAMAYVATDFLRRGTGSRPRLAATSDGEIGAFWGDSSRAEVLFRLLGECNAMLGICTPAHSLQWLSLQIQLTWGDAT